MRWLQPWAHDDPWEPPSEETSDAHLTQEEDYVHLRRAVDKLPEGQRAVVILRLLEECSTEETALILDIPYGTVLSRLKRGVDKLKKHIETTPGSRRSGGAL
jgi:RNA polymerase sigma-70 factor (ECF subfamily)